MKTYCDCHTDKPREVRVLPLNGDSNLIVCRQGHVKEMDFRRERNIFLAKENQFNTPRWEELQPYTA